MIHCSDISDGIRWLFIRHEIRDNLAQELSPVVTPIPPSPPEGLTNEVHSPHDSGDHHEHTG